MADDLEMELSPFRPLFGDILPDSMPDPFMHKFTMEKDEFFWYYVSIDPEPDPDQYEDLIREVEEEAGILNKYILVGTSLYMGEKINRTDRKIRDMVVLTHTTEYKITLTYMGTVYATSEIGIQVMNVIFNRILQDQSATRNREEINFEIVKNPVKLAKIFPCKQLEDKEVISTERLYNWRVLYPRGQKRRVTTFFSKFEKYWNKNILKTCEQPELIRYRNDTELKKLALLVENDNTMVIAVIKGRENFGFLQRTFCLQTPIPILVMSPEDLDDESIPRIACHIHCKMGWSKWDICDKVTPTNTMIIGIASYPDSENQDSYVGIVSHLDGNHTKHYTTWRKYSTEERIIDTRSIIAECLIAHKKGNDTWCNQIIIYRVGDGDEEYKGLNSEVENISKAFEDLKTDIKLAFITVQKRFQERFFVLEDQVFKDVAPGTTAVVEGRSIKLPELKDPSLKNFPPRTVIEDEASMSAFYLINEREEKKSFLPPIKYNIVHNDIGMTQDELEHITNEQCYTHHIHEFLKRPKSVPTVCDYAHEVAFLMGEVLHDLPNDLLKDKLFYI